MFKFQKHLYFKVISPSKKFPPARDLQFKANCSLLFEEAYLSKSSPLVEFSITKKTLTSWDFNFKEISTSNMILSRGEKTPIQRCLLSCFPLQEFSISKTTPLARNIHLQEDSTSMRTPIQRDLYAQK
jgi:hypothetical protein